MDLDETKAVAILGDTNSGKTNLAFHLLRSYKGNKKIYLLGYPKQIDNFKMLSDFNDIFLLTDSIIFIDEIHRFIKIYDKRTNQAILELLSLFSHNNNTLIFTTQLSQFITKTVENFIDGWCLTKIKDIHSLKNGSKPKRIIQNTVHPKCTRWSLALNPGEYLENCEGNPIGENSLKTFPFQGIQKDWRLSHGKCDKNCDKKAKKNVFPQNSSQVDLTIQEVNSSKVKLKPEQKNGSKPKI